MQRVAGARLLPGRPLVHSIRDPELLACVRGALERREICFGRASLVAPGNIFEVIRRTLYFPEALSSFSTMLRA